MNPVATFDNRFPGIRLTKQGALFSGSAEKLEEWQVEFARRHYLRLPALLDPELVDFIQTGIDSGEFRERAHEGIASNKELCMTGKPAFCPVLFFSNDGKLILIIQNPTQSRP